MIGSADADRAALYRNLAALESAGVPAQDALRRVDAPALEPVREKLREGAGLSEAFAASSGMTPLEVRLIKAGETAGKLPDVYGTLASLFEARSNAKRQLAADLAYPIFLLHAAVFLPPLGVLVGKGSTAYGWKVLPPLAVLYGGLVAIWLVVRFLKASSPSLLDGFLGALPVVGAISRGRAHVLALTALSATYEAGVPVIAAVESAADACPSPIAAAAYGRVADELRAGLPLGQAFAAHKASFPRLLVDAATMGEVSGKLDVLLVGARKSIEQEVELKRGVLMKLIPPLVFLCVAGFVGYQIVTGYLGQINRALDLGK